MSDHEAPALPEETSATLSSPNEPGRSFGTTDTPPRKRGPRMALGAVGLVVALLAGFLIWQFSRSDGGSTARASLSFAFAEGDTHQYRIHMTMDGTVDAGMAGLGEQPVDADYTQVFSWTVVEVAADGVATVEVRFEEGTGSVNGQPVPISNNYVSTQMRIAPDGRILSAGNLTFPSGASSNGAGFPGMSQLTPLLPDHPVAPGDSWEKNFEQDFPFGEGTISYTTQNTFDRYEDVDGTEAAVITSRIKVPLDFTLEFGELLEAVGGGSTTPDPNAVALGDATITYGGEGTFESKSWVDLTNDLLLRSSSSGSFDITMTFSGIPTSPDGTQFSFNGQFTQDVERL